jgi:beta-glucosidase
VNVALGPVVGPLGRVVKGGRNWEGFSNDPYLAGALVDPAVRGLQQSVVACVKHFIANEQVSVEGFPKYRSETHQLPGN